MAMCNEVSHREGTYHTTIQISSTRTRLQSELLLEFVVCYLHCSKEYRKEILYPVLQHLARRHGQSDLYEGLVSELDPLVVPNGVSEMELKMRQAMMTY